MKRRQQRNLYLSGWRTGSAAWLYLIGIEYLLGLQADYDGLRIRPNLPEAWANATATRHFRGATYHVRFVGFGSRVSAITLNGAPLEGDQLPLPREGSEHHVEVTLQAAACVLSTQAVAAAPCGG